MSNELRWSPKREEAAVRVQQALDAGDEVSPKDLAAILAVSEFEALWRNLRPQISGKLAARGYEKAMEGDTKMLTFMLQASSPEIFDSAVRAANVSNAGNWLNTLLQAKLDMDKAESADPLSEPVAPVLIAATTDENS